MSKIGFQMENTEDTKKEEIKPAKPAEQESVPVELDEGFHKWAEETTLKVFEYCQLATKAGFGNGFVYDLGIKLATEAFFRG